MVLISPLRLPWARLPPSLFLSFFPYILPRFVSFLRFSTFSPLVSPRRLPVILLTYFFFCLPPFEADYVFENVSVNERAACLGVLFCVRIYMDLCMCVCMCVLLYM